MTMNRNILVVALVAAVAVAAGLGYWVYQDQHKPGLEVEVGGNRLTIRGN
jgi:hypothetical protein